MTLSFLCLPLLYIISISSYNLSTVEFIGIEKSTNKKKQFG